MNFSAYQLSGVVATVMAAWENGIIEYVSDFGPVAVSDVAECYDLSVNKVELVVDVLVECGFFVKGSDGLVDLSIPFATVDNNLPRGLIGDFKYHMHIREFLGKDAMRYDRNDGSIESRGEIYSLDMRFNRTAQFLNCVAMDIAGKLRSLIPANSRVLDVGCGSGVWSECLHRKSKGTVNVTFLDLPEVIEGLKKSLASNTYRDEFSFVEHDYHSYKGDGKGYDVIIAANIIHLEASGDVVALFRSWKEILTDEGIVVVIDHLDEGSLSSALYALNLGMRTTKGRRYKGIEVTELADGAGLSLIEAISPKEYMEPNDIWALVFSKKGE